MFKVEMRWNAHSSSSHLEFVKVEPFYVKWWISKLIYHFPLVINTLEFAKIPCSKQFHFGRHCKNLAITINNALCIKSAHIDSLFWLTSQSVSINRMRTHTNKVYFAISLNRLSCQFAEKGQHNFEHFFHF